MIELIVSSFAVTAGSVAVLQFFLALDESARSAAEATWVVKVSRWCSRTWRGGHERIAWELGQRHERAAAKWSAEIGHGTPHAALRLAGARPVAGTSDATGPPRRARPAPAPHDAEANRNGAGPAHAARVTPLPVAVPDHSERNGRAHWVWLTPPESYADADGSDRLDLDASADDEPGGWWTCDEATRKGDLVLAYGTGPRTDLRYLIEVESDAYRLDDQRVAPSGGYGCDYRVLHELDPPISVTDLQADPVTARWQAVHVNFQRRRLVPPEVWDRLAAIIAQRDPRAGRLLRDVAGAPAGRRPRDELASLLFDQPQRLRRIGLDAEPVGRHIPHPHGGLLDLLFRDRRTGDYVVVALEPGRGGRAAVAQLLEGVAGVRDLYETPASVRGLLVAADLDRRADLMLRGAGSLEFAHLDDLGLSLPEA